MDAKQFKENRKVHWNSDWDCSSDEDSDWGCKGATDFLYEKYKPAPVQVDPEKHTIIVVGPEEEDVKTPVLSQGQKKRLRKKRRKMRDAMKGEESQSGSLLVQEEAGKSVGDDQERIKGTTRETNTADPVLVDGQSDPSLSLVVEIPLVQADLKPTKAKRKRKKKKHPAVLPPEVHFRLNELQEKLVTFVAMGDISDDNIVSEVDHYLQVLQQLNIPLSKCTLCLSALLKNTGLLTTDDEDEVFDVVRFFDEMELIIINTIANNNYESELPTPMDDRESHVFVTMCCVLFRLMERMVFKLNQSTVLTFYNPIFLHFPPEIIQRSYFLNLGNVMKKRREQREIRVANQRKELLEKISGRLKNQISHEIIEDLTRERHFFHGENYVLGNSKSWRQFRETYLQNRLPPNAVDNTEPPPQRNQNTSAVEQLLRDCSPPIVITAVLLLLLFQCLTPFIFFLLGYTDAVIWLLLLLYLCSYFLVTFNQSC